MMLIMLVVIWSCGLTPLWANILCSVLAVLYYVFKFFLIALKSYAKDQRKQEEKLYSEDSYGR